jgi:hypothetical protein
MCVGSELLAPVPVDAEVEVRFHRAGERCLETTFN